tara:strand:+ start:297 stop:569 length:273 start_codon:yes stop_codon:yes gene_type:complete
LELGPPGDATPLLDAIGIGVDALLVEPPPPLYGWLWFAIVLLLIEVFPRLNDVDTGALPLTFLLAKALVKPLDPPLPAPVPDTTLNALLL